MTSVSPWLNFSGRTSACVGTIGGFDPAGRRSRPRRSGRNASDEASVTVLLVVMMSLERHSGQLVGGGAACGSGSERN